MQEKEGPSVGDNLVAPAAPTRQAGGFIRIGAKSAGIKVRARDFVQAVRAEGYEISARVGRGAFGTVFRVAPSNDSKPRKKTSLALKVCAGEESRACYERELSALKRFSQVERKKHRHERCPYLPRLKNSFSLLVDGVQPNPTTTTGAPDSAPQQHDRPESPPSRTTVELLCLVTRYYDCGNLRTFINRYGQPSAADCFRWFTQITEAVARAHDCGVAHCDIKLDNILLGRREPGGEEIFAVLCDWGLSECDSPRRLTCARGTLSYAAPELARSIYTRLRIRRLSSPTRRRALDDRRRAKMRQQPFDGFACDSWAVGVCLWAMGVGLHPFDGKDIHAIMRRIENFEVLLAEHRALYSGLRTRGMPRDFWDTVQLLLRRRPQDRYQFLHSKDARADGAEAQRLARSSQAINA